MLSGYDLRVKAFTHADDAVAFHCRACVVKLIGEAAMQRLESGLSDEIDGWEREPRYSVDEHAVEWGYEAPTGCNPVECHARWRIWESNPRGDSEPSAISPDNGQAFCEVCATTDCVSCGARLDTTPEEEAVELTREAAGRTA